MMKKEGCKLNLMAQFEPLVRLRIFYRGHGKQKKDENVCKNHIQNKL